MPVSAKQPAALVCQRGSDEGKKRRRKEDGAKQLARPPARLAAPSRCEKVLGRATPSWSASRAPIARLASNCEAS
eukprot:SAG22_NODE_3061_length_1972_cov_0.942872_2_plen_75_part_00